jgi:hypothetical protein
VLHATRALRNVLVRLVLELGAFRIRDMEFSDTYKHSGPCVFSPDARFLAVAVDYRLVIRDVVSLKVLGFLGLFLRNRHMLQQYTRSAILLFIVIPAKN